MSQVAALKLVEAPAFYSRDIEIADDLPGDEASHSLHYSVQLPGSVSPSLAAYFISRFSKKGQVVLDPFSSSASVALEAALMGRIAKSSDIDPLALEINRAKLQPCDLTEVTLKLQSINLKRPVELSNYRQIFSVFYDLDTYREIVNLRDYLLSNRDKTSVFISSLCLGILHGNNAGYLSSYSHPHISLSVNEQQKINFQRAQSPDYRPLAPRILRKSAFVLREGLPSVLKLNAAYNACTFADARNLTYLPSSSVDLIVTRPPALKSNEQRAGDEKHDAQWLRNWFIGNGPKPAGMDSMKYDIDSWKDFMNESLLELARVLKSGGRAILQFQSLKSGSDIIHPDEICVDLVNESLGRYWEAEGVYIQKLKTSKIRKEQKSTESVYSMRNARALVLRRR